MWQRTDKTLAVMELTVGGRGRLRGKEREKNQEVMFL